MSALHDALSSLGPISWDDTPTDSPDELRQFADEIFSKAQLVLDSVPEAPTSPSQPGSRTSQSSTSTSSSSLSSDSSVPFTSQVPESELATLRREWGKPIKMNDAKENPLGIPMYKLSGKDGKGAWFARRSVHVGVPFDRWRAKMQAEMQETLKAREEERRQGITPTKAVRGVGCDKLLEAVDIPEAGGASGGRAFGKLEVYLLSAQFPGPTTARDFVSLIATTEAQPGEGEKQARNSMAPWYMIVSKPCHHPEAPPRDGYVRGQYESVELIRELVPARGRRPSYARATTYPTKLPDPGSETRVRKRANSSPRGARSKTGTAVKEAEGEGGNEHVQWNIEKSTSNPVEWIMVTRSDPGGSVPRWMVERGTPKSIASDAAKFLNWVSQPDESTMGVSSDIGETVRDVESSQKERAGVECGEPAGIHHYVDKQTDTADISSIPTSGLWSSIYNMANWMLGQPKSILGYAFGYSTEPSDGHLDLAGSEVNYVDDAVSTASDDYASAESSLRGSTPGTISPIYQSRASSVSADRSMRSKDDAIPESISAALTGNKDAKAKPSSEEKNLAKLAAKRRAVESKLSATNAEIEGFGGRSTSKDDTESDRDSNSDVPKESPETARAGAQEHKRLVRLRRNQSKLSAQLRKIDGQQIKLAQKLESRKRRAAARNEKSREKSRAGSEVQEMGKEIANLRTEVLELRAEREKLLDIIGRLQKENTSLAARSGLISKGYGTD